MFSNNELSDFYTKRKFLDEGIAKSGDLDLISWITFANLFKSEPELAYHAYYIAHLNDHRKIKANSDLIFEMGNEESARKTDEERNVDKILRNII